jgi:glycosyltransferase involved in cell wall biosynthesis
MTEAAIGFLCHSRSWGGLEMNVLRLARWLHQRGNRIILYGCEGSVLFEKAAESGLPVRHLLSHFKYGDFINAHRLTELIAHDNVDLLLLHERKDIMLGTLTKHGTGPGLRLVYLQHMHIGVNKRDLYHTWLFGNLDAWIVPLEILKERLLDKTHYPAERIAVIPFGIELDLFANSRTRRQEARDLLELPHDAIIAGMVGRLEEDKNQETLIRALPLLHQNGIDAHALIVGDETMHEQNQYRDRLLSLIDQRNLNNHVHLRPFIDQPELAYAAMDIFTLTSKSETYGMVTIEAMASGLPVIGTRHGGTREIIAHESNGLHIERERPEELAAAVARILRDEIFAQQLARQARDDALSKYSHTRQCELFEQLADKLRSGHRPD